MKSLTGDEINQGGGQEPGAHGEKIFVSVRVRPLNEKEIAKNDSCDWECVSNDTILYKSGLAEQRSTHPNAYTFGKQSPSPCESIFLNFISFKRIPTKSF